MFTKVIGWCYFVIFVLLFIASMLTVVAGLSVFSGSGKIVEVGYIIPLVKTFVFGIIIPFIGIFVSIGLIKHKKWAWYLFIVLLSLGVVQIIMNFIGSPSINATLIIQMLLIIVGFYSLFHDKTLFFAPTSNPIIQ